MRQSAGTPTKTRRGSVPVLHSARWPGPVHRLVLTGGVLGSFLGLVLGLMTGDRPLLDVLVLYLLGFLFAVLTAAAAGLVLTRLRARHHSRDRRQADPGS